MYCNIFLCNFIYKGGIKCATDVAVNFIYKGGIKCIADVARIYSQITQKSLKLNLFPLRYEYLTVSTKKSRTLNKVKIFI